MNWCFFGLPAGKVRNPHESVFYEVVFPVFLRSGSVPTDITVMGYLHAGRGQDPHSNVIQPHEDA